MSEKPPEKEDGLLKSLKNLWAPIAGFLGAVMLAYNFYQLWTGDWKTVTWFLAGGGLIALTFALFWVIFKTENVTRTRIPTPTNPNPSPAFEKQPAYLPIYRQAAVAGLVLVSLLLILGVAVLIQRHQTQEQYLAEREKKLIVLIAAFEGPEEVYGLRNEIIEKLHANLSFEKDVEIITTDEIITLSKGSTYARHLGEEYLADIVIWGWYRPTENPNITIHVENLAPTELISIKESETLQPVAALSELESFSFQQQAGQETSALIMFLAGIIDDKANNDEAAIDHFDQALSMLPDTPLLYENRANIYFYRGGSNLSLGEYQRSIDDYQKALELDSHLSLAHNNLGVAYAILGDYAFAIQAYSMCLTISPDSHIFSNRGVAYASLGENEKAIQDFNQAIKIDSQNASALFNRGLIYFDLQQFESAIQDFSKVIEIDLEHTSAYEYRGNAYAGLGQYERAIQEYTKALDINPRNENAYNNRGLAYVGLDQYDLALKEFDQAIEMNPQMEKAYNNRGGVYIRLGQVELAIQDFGQAIEINPEDISACMNRGRLYVALGEYQRAIQDFDRAVQIDPQSAEAYYNRGHAYDSLKQFDQAIIDYTQTIQITPQDAEIYNDRGIAYGKLEQYDQAIADFTRAIQIDPENANGYNNLGLAYEYLTRTSRNQTGTKICAFFAQISLVRY